MKKLALLGTITLAAIALAPSSAQAADTNGQTEAVVKIEAAALTGEIKFKDLSTSAHIKFADTTLNGTAQTAQEETSGAATVVISDTRSGVASGSTGGYRVTVKDVTTASALDFLSNNLALKLNSSDIAGKGTHVHNAITVSTAEQNVFSGKYEAGITEKAVVLNPTLGIPADLTADGDYKANLEWTLVPSV